MKKGQVFVRAKNKDGRWDNIDVLDLDQPSFNAFVTEQLFRAGLVTGIKPEYVEGEEIEYTQRKENANTNEKAIVLLMQSTLETQQALIKVAELIEQFSRLLETLAKRINGKIR